MIPKHIIDSHKKGDFQTAIRYYQKQMTQQPKSHIWPSLIGVIHAQNHDYFLAYDFFIQACSLEKTADNLAHLATACVNLKKWDEAESYFRESLTKRPFAPGVHNNYGIYYLKQLDYANAKTHLYMALSQDGTIVSAYFNLGLCHMHLGEFKDAQHRFTQALSLDPSQYTAHYQLALAHEMQKHWKEACEHYQICLKAAEHEAASHGMGRCLIKLGNASEALDHLKKSFILGGESQELWHNLGMCYLQLASPALALEAWNKTAKYENNIDTNYHIGVCYQQMFRYDDATLYFKQALKLEKDHLDSYLNLIAIAIERYQIAEALDWIKQARQFYPSREDLIYLQASISQNHSVERAPTSYITQLFDSYAHHYDAHVLKQLKYQLPNHLKKLLATYTPLSGWKKACDMGCGTGLCGKIIAEYTTHLTGIDLSKDMLKVADSLSIYHQLHEEDIIHYLNRSNDRYDLMNFGDVLPYCGTLEWLKTLHKNIDDQGIVILSIEVNTTIDTFHLHEHARFSHNPNYIQACMENFQCLEIQNVALRTHMNKNVDGNIMLFRKS